jgi:Cu/Ag efflux protein CusF
MNAMTMGFQIPDEQTLKSLKSGDQIEARLIFDSRTNLSWLENIRTTPAPPSGEAAP